MFSLKQNVSSIYLPEDPLFKNTGRPPFPVLVWATEKKLLIHDFSIKKLI